MGLVVVTASLIAAAPEDPVTRKIRADVQNHFADLAQCVGPDVEDPVQVDVAFSVWASGKVVEARLVDTWPPNPALGRCVVGVLRTLKLGRTEVPETWVEHSFTFAPTHPRDPDLRRQFLGPAMSLQRAFIHLYPRVPFALSGLCARKVCVPKDETAAMCVAFGEGTKRLKAGADYYEVVGPIAAVAHDLCCNDVVERLDAIENMFTFNDRMTVWCDSQPSDVVRNDAGHVYACGCREFEEFWRAFDRQPKGWVPLRRETVAPPRVSKPKPNEL